MNIITGTAKGMKLLTLEGDNTRPTSQRVKEAIFSMLQFDIEGARVLDLFAGSGQLGLEALSRGAQKATFSDSSAEATEIIIKNAKKARLFSNCRVSTCDYAQMIRGISGKEQYDIIFIDPPYKTDFIRNALKMLIDGNVISDNAFVVCESGKESFLEPNDEILNSLDIYKKSKYSVTYVTVLRPKATKE